MIRHRNRFRGCNHYEGLANRYLKADSAVSADLLSIAAESCKAALQSVELRVETQAVQRICRQMGWQPNEFCNPYRARKYDAVMNDLLAAFEGKHVALLACGPKAVNDDAPSIASYEAAQKNEENVERAYWSAIREAAQELFQADVEAERKFLEATSKGRDLSEPVCDDLVDD